MAEQVLEELYAVVVTLGVAECKENLDPHEECPAQDAALKALLSALLDEARQVRCDDCDFYGTCGEHARLRARIDAL